MTKSVLIIHSSSIIAEGLGSILGKQFDVSWEHIFTFSDKEWSENENWHLIFCEVRLANQLIAMKNQFSVLGKIIIIGLGKNVEKENSIAFDASIDLNISKSELFDYCSKYLMEEKGDDAIREGFLLSAREQEVLILIAKGFSNKKIAESLYISVHTVISHRKNISEKTGIKSVSGLTVYAILHNLVDPEYLLPDTSH